MYIYSREIDEFQLEQWALYGFYLPYSHGPLLSSEVALKTQHLSNSGENQQPSSHWRGQNRFKSSPKSAFLSFWELSGSSLKNPIHVTLTWLISNSYAKSLIASEVLAKNSQQQLFNITDFWDSSNSWKIQLTKKVKGLPRGRCKDLTYS